MISYWEKQSFINYDCIIIGSGIVGLNAAIYLKQLKPKLQICIVERGLLPSGASTKNAGFACMGSPTELLADLEITSEQSVLQLFEKRMTGLQSLIQLLGEETIGYTTNGSYELLSDSNLAALDKIDYLNALLQPITGKDAFSVQPNIINNNNFNSNTFKSAVQNNLEGQIHTGKMMRALIAKASNLGVEIKTGCTVQQLEENNNQATINCTNGWQTIVLQANQILICTNGFANQLVSNIDLQPGRGIVCITKPIEALPFSGSYHIDEGYYYFRTIDNRVLLGGGRNLDFASETTITLALNPLIVEALFKKLKEDILPNIEIEIDLTWSGIMAFGKDKNPLIQTISPHVHMGVRCGGMGVAMGIHTAHQLVEKVYGL
jgi:glycine/D-amino acid oxidase-like deaminating enzyme